MQHHARINGVHFWWITKQSFDYHKASGTNSYWTMSSQKRSELHLPRNFQKENYDNIDEWYHVKPIMNPLHTRDLSQLGDGVYKHTEAFASLQHNELQNGVNEEDCTNHSDAALFQAQQPCVGSSFLEKTIHPRSAFTNFDQNIPRNCSTPTLNGRGAHFAANGTALSTCVGPVNLLSSSEASLQEITCKYGNTGQRRKSLLGHSKIAEATNSLGEKLVITLEKLNEKDSKLQWDMFHEQLKYNRVRDLINQENAHLTHANQGNLVQAIASLTQVLSASLQLQSFPGQSFSHTHPPYSSPQLPYRASTNYGLATNREAPPTYAIATYRAPPTYGPTTTTTPGGPTSMWTRIVQHTTRGTMNGDASNDKIASPENLLFAYKY